MMMDYINFYIPEKLRLDADSYRRARQIVLFSHLGYFFFIPNMIKWYNLGSSTLAVSMFCVMIVVSLVSPFVLKATASISVAGNVVMAALCWHFAFLTAMTGGLESSSISWNLIIPLFAATFFGIKTMMFWTVVMTLDIAFLVLAKTGGMALPTIALTPKQLLETEIANAIGPFIATAASCYFFHKGLESALGVQKEALRAQEAATEEQEKARIQIEDMSRKLEQTFIEVGQNTDRLVSVTLKEIDAKTKQNAANAGQANNLMKEAGQVMSQAGNSMKELTASMQEITKASEDTSKIVKTIDEISFQTNLLALNAAVEAARAGETGAGFAVVADEVRNLAMRSAESARNTAEMIENTVKKVKYGADLVSKTNSDFVDVSTRVNKVTNIMDEIANDSKDQAHSIEDVGRAVGKIDRLLQQNSGQAPVKS